MAKTVSNGSSEDNRLIIESVKKSDQIDCLSTPHPLNHANEPWYPYSVIRHRYLNSTVEWTLVGIKYALSNRSSRGHIGVLKGASIEAVN